MRKFVLQRWLITLATSCMLVSLLSLVPLSKDSADQLRGDVGVFHADNKGGLDEDGIVLYFSGHSFGLQINHIDWFNRALFLRIQKPICMSEEEMYKELFFIFKDFLVVRENVERVRCYVNARRPVVIDAEREDIVLDPQMDKKNILSYREYIAIHFNIK